MCGPLEYKPGVVSCAREGAGAFWKSVSSETLRMGEIALCRTRRRDRQSSLTGICYGFHNMEETMLFISAFGGFLFSWSLPITAKELKTVHCSEQTIQKRILQLYLSPHLL